VEESSFILPSRPAPTLRPLPILAVLLAISEIAANFLPEAQATRSLRFRVREMVTLPAPGLQIMGDSVAAGLPAAVIETPIRSRGLPVSNYALQGTSPLFAEYVLQRQIAAGRIPKAIIYAPHAANLGAPMLDRFLGRFARPDEALDLLRHGAPPSDWLFGELCKVSYTLRYREELHATLVEGRTDFFHSWYSPVRSVELSRIPQSLPEPRPSRPFSSADISPILARPLSIAPVVRASIDRFCDLAASRQVRIFWVSMPMPSSVASPENPGKRIYADYLKELAQRHPNVTLLYPQIDVLPDSDFTDPWHMTDRTAWLFAQTIGDILAARFAESPEIQ
jgi:hypothetical protein